MLTDGIQLLGASTATNLTIANGASLPVTDNNPGELFYQTGVGLHVYSDSAWTKVGGDVTSAAIEAALGYTPAALDGTGKVLTSQVPAIAITDTFVVATQAAMLALTAQVGDIAVRSDLSKSFILKTTGASTLANWQELLTPAGAADAGALTGNTLAAGVTLSSLTRLGTIGTQTLFTVGTFVDPHPLVTRAIKIGSGGIAVLGGVRTDSIDLTGTLSANGSTGTAGQVLTSNGGSPATWAAVSAGTAAAGTLTGTTLAANVVSSSLTSVGNLSGLTVLSGDTIFRGTPFKSSTISFVSTGVINSEPNIIMGTTLGGTDAKMTRFYADASGLTFDFINDAGGAGVTWLKASRSGQTATNIALTGTAITLTGAVTGTSFSGVGTALTALNATNLASGTVNTARLGSGTANSTTYLRGDNTWATVSGGGGSTATLLNGTVNFGSPVTTGLYAGLGLGSNNFPAIYWFNASGAADAKRATLYSHNTGKIEWYVSNDAGTVNIPFFLLNRTGTTVTDITFTTNKFDLSGLSTGLRLNDSAGTAGQVLTSNGNAAAPTWGGAAAGTLTGTALATNVVTSSLTALGTLSALAVVGTPSATTAVPTAITITGGANTSGANGAGGNVVITGGVGSGTSLGGIVQLVGGATTGMSSAPTITLGQGTGRINITCGSSSSASTSPGSFIVQAGNSTANTIGGANISLTAGSNTGGGAAGYIELIAGTANTGTPGYFAVRTGTTGTAERFRILSNGAWSVGTGGVATGTAGQLFMTAGNAAPPTWTTGLSWDNTAKSLKVVGPTGAVTGGAGAVLVTTDAGSNQGIVLQPSATLSATTDHAPSIAWMRDPNTTLKAIASIAALRNPGSYGGFLVFKTQDYAGNTDTEPTEKMRIVETGSVLPGVDNAQVLGSSGKRWSSAFFGTAPTVGSDAAFKEQIEDLSAAELAVARAAKGLLKKYKLKDAVVAKGDDARWHVGIIAQELEAAFAAEGLDAHHYGMFCSDTFEDADGNEVTRLSIRYEELLAFIIAAL